MGYLMPTKAILVKDLSWCYLINIWGMGGERGSYVSNSIYPKVNVIVQLMFEFCRLLVPIYYNKQAVPIRNNGEALGEIQRGMWSEFESYWELINDKLFIYVHAIPGRVISKTLKMVLDTSLLNTQQYKVRIKGKVCSSYWKVSLLVALDYGRQLYLLMSSLLKINWQSDFFIPKSRSIICPLQFWLSSHLNFVGFFLMAFRSFLHSTTFM